MPNLAGYYQRHGALDPSVLDRMSGAIDIPALRYLTERVAGPRAGCVNLSRWSDGRNSIAHDRSHNRWLVFDGELYNQHELRRWLAPAEGGDDTESDASLCLRAFARAGEGCADRLDGQFNLAVYDVQGECLRLINDRYGYRPLFISDVAGRLLFAVEMKAILAAMERLPALDELGVFQFLRDGAFAGDRTWVDSISVLPGGAVLTVTPGAGARLQRYFQPRYRDEAPRMTVGDFTDAFGSHLRKATEQRSSGPGRVGISLSGGLDSRAAFLAIPSARLPLVAYTFGEPDSRDVLYARELAARRRCPHVHLRFVPGYLRDILTRVVWRTEGLLNFTATTSIVFHRRIAQEMELILNGHCGDALTGSHITPAIMLARSRAAVIEQLFARRQVVADDALRLIFNPDFYRRCAGELRQAWQATFDHIDNEVPVNVADAWDMENRQRRGTFHSPSIDRYRFEQRTPFLDNQLADHLLTAPPRWRFQQYAYKRMLLRTFPEAARIPWAYTGNQLSESRALEIARIAVNYATKRLQRFWPNGRVNAAEFRDLESQVRDEPALATYLTDFTDSSLFPDSVFDRAGIVAIVRRHWSGEDHTDLVTGLLTIAAAVRLFAESPCAIPSDADPTHDASAAKELSS